MFRRIHSGRHNNAPSAVPRTRALGGAQNHQTGVWHGRLRSYDQRVRTKRVDFVSRLPLELVSTLILPSSLILPLRHTFAYLHVCRTWRQRVLQSVQLHYISVGRVTFGGKQIMIAYAPYITCITLGHPSELPLYFFSRSQFACLQSLILTLVSQNDMRAVVRLLQPITAVLKTINLTISHALPNAAIAFKDIMPNGSRLEAFTCNKIDMTGFIAHDHVHKYPNLKKLIITSITHPLEEKDIIGLLERFPSLQLLSLPQCQHSTPLSLMPQYCPFLDSLIYSVKQKAFEAEYHPRTDNQVGLHSVYLDTGENFHIEDIASLLASHYDTLISINMMGKMNHHPGGISSAILSQHVHFKRLTRLMVYPGDDDDDIDSRSALSEWIIKGAPNAKEIEAPRCNISHPDVYHTMTRMTDLESLSFALPSTALIDGLEYHGTTLKHRSKLQILSVDVHYSGEQCPRVWRAVAGLSNLRELFMQLRGATLDEEFVTFIEALARGCPELTQLILESPTDFPTAIIAKFPLYPKLEELTLGSPNFWDACLLDVLKCPFLQALYMDSTQMTDHVAIALAYLTGDAYLE